MKTIQLQRTISIVLILLFSSILLLKAQTPNTTICEDGDCSPEVFTIQLDAPLTPATTEDKKRTEQFKTAYFLVKQLKSNYSQKPGWDNKYQNFQLAGKSCLRLYQLEGFMAHEYELNPAFKSFIDQQESDKEAFLKNGFEASRRGLNLSKRMDTHCSNELKKLEKSKGPSLNDLPTIYQKLGQKLGYFDKDGNLLKPLDMPTNNSSNTASSKSKEPKKSKKEQVEDLKNKVAKLPVGSKMKDKIGGIGNAIKNIGPKLGILGGLLSALKPSLLDLLPVPVGMISRLNKLKNLLSGLNIGFKPKIPRPGIFSKIKDILKRGDNLKKKAEDLVEKSKKLKDTFDKVTKDTEDTKEKVKKHTDKIAKLKDVLDNLKKKKDDLTELLEDKPKKILDELKDKVKKVEEEATDLLDKVGDEEKAKDKLLEKLEELTKTKDEILEKLKELEEEAEVLEKEEEELEKEAEEVEKEIEEVKEEEAKQAEKEAAIEELKEDIEELKSEEEIQKEIDECEESLKEILAKILPVETFQEKLKKKLGGLLALPGKLLSKVVNLNAVHEKLKKGLNGIPLVGKALAKVDDLIAKSNIISNTIGDLTGKKTKLQEKIEGFSTKLENIKGNYDIKNKELEILKEELIELLAEKSKLKDTLGKPIEGEINEIDGLVKDFIKRFKLFDKKSDCEEDEELEEEIEELKTEQEETEPELEELEEELEKVEEEETQLETETEEVEEEIKEEAIKEEELEKEEETLKQEYGTDMNLDPVEIEEWVESFEVERPYWDAVFHPDDEVVEGYKGRYFEIRLKDANKNVKLLFGPGKYYMDKSDFRNNYGSTIGAFVTETLHSMKKVEKDQIKLFVQGSADIAGHETFKGNLDKKYYYNQITVLPLKEDDSFSPNETSKNIPQTNFRNSHLPDLRGKYLKEMITIYSKKLQPILLEGAVKSENDEGERNAIIYLFIPEQLVSSYEGN